MIKPISVKPIQQISNNTKTAIKDSAAKERLQSLIKEFEEVFKSQQNNIMLKKHIEYLKDALKKYQ